MSFPVIYTYPLGGACQNPVPINLILPFEVCNITGSFVSTGKLNISGPLLRGHVHLTVEMILIQSFPLKQLFQTLCHKFHYS